MMMHKEKLEYNKHLQTLLGEYLQGVNKPMKTNTQYPRTINTIYLTVNLNKRGDHVFMYLKYVLPVTRRKVTYIRVKNLVVTSVDKMASDNKMMTLKFENNSCVLLHRNDCLSGLEYEDKNANKKHIYDDEQNAHKGHIKKIKEGMHNNYMKL